VAWTLRTPHVEVGDRTGMAADRRYPGRPKRNRPRRRRGGWPPFPIVAPGTPYGMNRTVGVHPVRQEVIGDRARLRQAKCRIRRRRIARSRRTPPVWPDLPADMWRTGKPVCGWLERAKQEAGSGAFKVRTSTSLIRHWLRSCMAMFFPDGQTKRLRGKPGITLEQVAARLATPRIRDAVSDLKTCLRRFACPWPTYGS